MILNGLMEVKYKVESNGRSLIPLNRVEELLNTPNPEETKTAFYRRFFLDYMLEGNGFLNYESKDVALYIIPSDQTTIEKGNRNKINRYLFRSFQSYRQEEISFRPNEVIHLKGDGVSDIFRGDSQFKAIESLIKLYYFMISFQKQFFKNNTVPGIIFETTNVLSHTVKTRLLDEYQKSANAFYSNARSPVILDGGLHVKNLGTTELSKLDFENSINRVKQDISQSLGVPYDLINGNNNSNFSQLRKEFFQQTILPIASAFADAYGNFFNARVSIDTAKIPALKEDLRGLQVFHSGLVNTGIETTNEARVALGLPPISFDQMEGEHDPNKVRVAQNIAGSAVDMQDGNREGE